MTAAKVDDAPPPRLRRRRNHEVAFLPAALEIVETPPSPIGRAIGGVIIAFFAAAILWASVSTIDIIAVAPGKIMPSGSTKTIQPLESGIVRAIHVEDGRTVKAGDILIELDSTVSDADRSRNKADLEAAQVDAARLRAELSDTPDPLAAFNPPTDADPTLVATQRQLLASEIAERRAKSTAVDNQKLQKEKEVSTIAATIAKIEATLPILRQRYDIRRTLMEKDLGSKLLYLQEQQDLVNGEHDLQVQKSRYAEAVAALAAITATRDQVDAEFRHKISDELSKAEQKVAALTQDLVKSVQRTKERSLIAPIDGVVQELAVHTVGGIVTPAQTLLVLVPIDRKLEVVATIANQDIGFVEVGQPAEIKVRTFDFTKYGLIHGVVQSVSLDAVRPDAVRDMPGGKSPDSVTTGGSDPSTKELAYIGRISLDRTQMKIEDKIVNLAPGMAVTVEIVTGKRSIISYLLSPLVRYEHDNMRER
ncbi:hemolysin D [Enhydrobacter aerosaccus]|uniref:Membrane fusion protein (MFP) family protein n=1 Tax=Enhydrobacter aerosaccus TaxID=225324 RepID=A0A1T4SCF9_9HYPH|nr:HlyD family type I secretion periplasmic adaptor subunit [Enhydrobacter aerosaccus]SKA25806.1 hemolysin D [Enhydrobacter aerosaccus]